jgi:hypothetical protein
MSVVTVILMLIHHASLSWTARNRDSSNSKDFSTKFGLMFGLDLWANSCASRLSMG